MTCRVERFVEIGKNAPSLCRKMMPHKPFPINTAKLLTSNIPHHYFVDTINIHAQLQLSSYSASVSISGSGTSKKLAKRNAAAKMLSRIHDVPVDLRTSNDAEAEDDTFNMVSNQFRRAH